ncbi:type IV pilus modification protein PilV [Salinisphaera sp. PC39]|uniref:type IV pilus modification protein PilV n=1 Tax=Salinisphaera sp. PC39 TaxID=1304156 RepID=UPI003340AD2D
MRRARGFGLIEVLITLLVFSIGVLAVAGLQAISKKNNYDALQRNTAANLADAIIASMRANPDALSAYLVPADAPLGSRDNTSAPEVNCYDTACSPAELAAFDLWQWELALDGATELAGTDGNEETGGLASPSACIDGPAGGGAGIYRVILVWRGVTRLESGAGEDCGSGRGLYAAPDDTAGAASDERYQRSLVVTTYIAP